MKPHASGHWWALGVTGAFALFICGIAALVFLAVSGREDLVADDCYERGLRYEERIETLKRTQNKGYTPRIQVEGREILVCFGDSSRYPAVSGRMLLYRPANRSLDRQFMLAPDSAGIHHTSTASLEPGLWRVQVVWSESGRAYYAEQPVMLQ